MAKAVFPKTKRFERWYHSGDFSGKLVFEFSLYKRLDRVFGGLLTSFHEISFSGHIPASYFRLVASSGGAGVGFGWVPVARGWSERGFLVALDSGGGPATVVVVRPRWWRPAVRVRSVLGSGLGARVKIMLPGQIPIWLGLRAVFKF